MIGDVNTNLLDAAAFIAQKDRVSNGYAEFFYKGEDRKSTRLNSSH